jgi:hypothetical protein
MRASIVAGGDAPPILEPCEHILDFVALLIERLVVGQRDFPAFGGGNAGLATSFGKSIPEPIAIITTVGKQCFRGGQGIKDQPRTLVIAHLPLAEQQDEGLTFAVADSVELRVQAAFRAPDAAGNSPFFKSRGPVRLQMGGVNHNALWLWPFAGEGRENQVKRAEPAPTDKAVVRSCAGPSRAAHLRTAPSMIDSAKKT